jgi:hypothetical protein
LQIQELFGEAPGKTGKPNMEMAYHLVPGMEKIPAGAKEK